VASELPRPPTLSGSKAGAALGRGLYVTTTLQKALNYAERNPRQGAILELRVQLGRCYNVAVDDSNRTKWKEMGYDSAWATGQKIGKAQGLITINRYLQQKIIFISQCQKCRNYRWRTRS
jgi:hypothetical protein